MKHPQFLTDTKLAISEYLIYADVFDQWTKWFGLNLWSDHIGETYKKTDKDFLDIEKDQYRDDGSTASTVVLVGNHLYVANVGDSRTVTSKSGIGMFYYSNSIIFFLNWSWKRGLSFSFIFLGQQFLCPKIISLTELMNKRESKMLVVLSCGLVRLITNLARLSYTIAIKKLF